jgi:hypothetical protein
MLKGMRVSFGAGVLSLALASAALAQGPTYSKEISRIYQAKCQVCHHDGDIAPFSLNNYDDAVNWAFDTRRVVKNGTMPPWKPVAGYGDFRDNISLTADEKQAILDWIANEMPEGDPADLPDRITYNNDWPLGAPDVTLAMPQSFTPEIGGDVYRCFVLPETGLSEDTYLSAIDVMPGNRQIVHHVIIFADTTGTAAQLDGQDGQPGYSCFGGPGIPVNTTNILQALDSLSGLGGWAPGTRAHFLPDNIGTLLPGGARVVMQVHYHPVGVTGPDQTQIGLYFMRSEIQKRLYHIPVVNMDFKVPPDSVRDVTAVFPPIPLPLSAKAINIFPHMHLLGRKIKADLIDITGKVTPMIYEDNWDFNWQGAYTYADAIPIPNFSKIRVTCTFDNTADNPKNPNNPLVTVGWGERTTDEMCLAFVGVTLDVDPFTILRNIKPVMVK